VSRLRRIHFRDVYPLAVLVVMIIAMLVIGPAEGVTVNTTTFYGVLQIFADYGLVALAIGLTIIVGEYDLSVTGTYILGGLVAVKLGEHSPVLGILAAVAMGIIAGLVQGGIIAIWKISSVPVTLGGYLTLVGVAYVISSGNILNDSNFGPGETLDATHLGIFSLRSGIALIIFAMVWAVMRWTRVGPQIRAVGGDRRASRTSGVPVGRTLLLVMTTSGALSALGGALTAYSLASATPSDTDLTALLFGTIAAVLGGVALAGGRGSAAGIAVGALTYSALQEILGIVGAAQELSDVITGAVLLTITVLAAPDLRTQLRLARTRHTTSSPTAPAAESGARRP
jgi:ribose transport system permease protein